MPGDDVQVQMAAEADRAVARVLGASAQEQETSWAESIMLLRYALRDAYEDVRFLARMVPPQHRERRSALFAAEHVKQRLEGCPCAEEPACRDHSCRNYRCAFCLALAWNTVCHHEQQVWAVLGHLAARAAPRGDGPRAGP